MKARYLTLGLGLFLSTAVHAVEIDFSQKLLDLDDKPYRDCGKANATKTDCDDWIEHTLGLIAFSAMERPDPQLGVIDQARRGALGRKVYKGGKVDLSSKDIDLIVEQIGKLGLRPAEVLRAVEALDPARLK